MPETAKRTARVPILGEDGRISDDYVPAAIGEGVESAEAAATRAETAATAAEGSATAAGQSASGAQGSASAASASAAKAQESAATAGGAATSAQSAQTAAEAAKAAAETAQSAAAGSAQDAQQSAAAAAQSAASVADKFIASAQATTLEPGSQATASVANQVLTIGVPKGEKGDKGDTGEKGDPGTTPTVVAAEGSDLSVSTDEGTVTIDDSALRARISELEQQTQNVVTGTSTDLVAHGEDAYAQRPREVRIKGKTWVNRWPVIEGTNNGITVATDETGLVTVTGTATADADVSADVSGWATGKSYTAMVSATPTGCSAYFEVQKPSGNTSINATTTGATLNVASDATNCVAGVHVTSGTTVNASFRVMLVDGTEAPDCFTPCASITSVQPENLVTAGKNLLERFGPALPYTTEGITFSDNGDGGIRVSGTTTASAYYNFFNTAAARATRITPGEYAASLAGQVGGVNLNVGYYYYEVGGDHASWLATNVYGVSNTGSIDRPVYLRAFLSVASGTTVDTVVYPQLELGSTATAYELPTVTQTPLPEVELRGLPNGTCDELVIKEDGTCTVERKIVTINASDISVLSAFVPADGSNKPYVFFPSNSFETSSARFTASVVSDTWPSEPGSLRIESVYRTWNGLVFVSDEFADKGTALSMIKSRGGTFVFEAPASAEPQSPVTLPALPAPTFNAYHDSPVPSDTSTTYVRDINLVLGQLDAKIAALSVAQATS